MEPISHILDEETRKKLVGFLPFSEDATIEFTPSVFLQKKKIVAPDGTLADSAEDAFPADIRPVFHLKCFTTAQAEETKRIRLKGAAGNMGQKEMDALDFQLFDIIRTCVKGWRSLYDLGSLTEIVYEADASGIGAKGALFDKIPVWIKKELMIYICRMSSLLPGDESALK